MPQDPTGDRDMKIKMMMYQDSMDDWYNGEFRKCVRNVNLYRAVALKLNAVQETHLEIRDL